MLDRKDIANCVSCSSVSGSDLTSRQTTLYCLCSLSLKSSNLVISVNGNHGINYLATSTNSNSTCTLIDYTKVSDNGHYAVIAKHAA